MRRAAALLAIAAVSAAAAFPTGASAVPVPAGPPTARAEAVLDEALRLEALIASETAEIETLEERTTALGLLLGAREAEAYQLSVESAALEARLGRARSALSDAALWQYKTGGGPSLAVRAVLESESLADAMSAMDYVSRVSGSHAESARVARESSERLAEVSGRQAAVTAATSGMRARYAADASRVASEVAGLRARHAEVSLRLDAINAEEMAYQQQYIAAAMASIDSTSGAVSELRSRVVSMAVSQVGKPYVWGATGPSTFDCSGLMLWSHRSVGMQIPRTSRAQYAGTRHVTREQLLPGDMVFLGGSPASIHHVMMYIGGGYTVEAPRTGDRVKVRPLSSRSPGSIVGYSSAFPAAVPEKP